MSESLLIATDVSKRFGKVEALRSASFSVEKGHITSFLGENGAGKTTSLKCILGFLKPESGRVERQGEHVGYVPEYPVFFNWLQGKEIIAYTAKLYGLGRSVLDKAVEAHCEKIGFDAQQLLRKVHTYSLGNRKKFAYLQNLIISPQFLVVDEPFYSLDPVSIVRIRELFLELRGKGVTLLLSSHLISEVEKITDEVIIIKKGQVVIQENVKNLKDNFLLYRLDKYMAEREDLLSYSPFVRERETYVELLIPRNKKESFASFLAKREQAAEAEELSLEKIFLFFTK